MNLWHPFTQMQGFRPLGRVASAEGPWLVLEDGRRVFDGISSWWVNVHGHCHPHIAAAIAAQAGRLDQVILADFTHGPAADLTEALIRVLPGDLDHVFYSDDGSTSVEVALKMAWQGQRARDPARRRLVAFEDGYHGDTLGAMAVTSRDAFSEPFHDLLAEVDFVDVDPAAIDAYFARFGHEVVACIIEPMIQGAGGFVFHAPETLRGLADACERAGAWLICDEVMTGFGRTGPMFACERAGVVPDLMCLSKGITGGVLALGATAARRHVYERFLHDDKMRAFLHGHSYTGNPITCAAAVASLELFEREGTLENVAAIERAYRERLPEIAALPGVTGARCMGGILAFEIAGGPGGYFDPIGRRVTDRVLDAGLYLRPLGETVYLLPPLCTTPEQIHWCIDALAAAVRAEIG